jgi:hypothetical protein
MSNAAKNLTDSDKDETLRYAQGGQ